MAGIGIYIAGSLVLGVLACFYGKKFYFPVLMALVWLGTVAVGMALLGVSRQSFAVSAVVGAVLALLARFLYKLGVFLLGAALGAGAGLLLAPLLPPQAQAYGWVLALALALLFGVCATRWCLVFIMASTAHSGAAALAAPVLFLLTEGQALPRHIHPDGLVHTMLGLQQYLHGAFAAQHSTALLAATLALTLAGFLVQLRASRR